MTVPTYTMDEWTARLLGTACPLRECDGSGVIPTIVNRVGVVGSVGGFSCDCASPATLATALAFNEKHRTADPPERRLAALHESLATSFEEEVGPFGFPPAWALNVPEDYWRTVETS